MRCRVRCVKCHWRGIRTRIQCECYDIWAMYCRPGSPGPGCPAGVVWPCPRCGPVDNISGSGARDGSSVRFIGYVEPRKSLLRS